MCGIVGYIGHQQAYPILIKGLHRLEYRGYDSAGVALINSEDRLNVYKTRGKVNDLEAFCESKDIEGTIGIAHTRWATHGEPNDVNAHPHYSSNGKIAIVHNGTIENYNVLKQALEQHGCVFRSETDTEVVVQLIEYIQSTNRCPLIDAVREALNQVIGAYAIVVIDSENPDTIIAARKSSPLVIGIGEGETFIASDATPIIDYTNQVVYLRDDEIAIISRGEPLRVITNDNRTSSIDIQTLRLSVSQLEKGGYPHFMLKEIFEQPNSIYDCIRGRIVNNGTEIKLSGITDHPDRFINASRIIIVACGTSWHAALIGARLFESIARIPAQVEYASEFRYSNPVVTPQDIVIAISQSGETADTLAAIKLAKERGAFVYGVCNVVSSSIARETDTGTYIHVGPEIGVASTKAFTGQVTVLTMLALAIGQLRCTISKEKLTEMAHALINLPELIKETLKLNKNIERLSSIFTYAHNFLYLGRGYNYPSALEGALKLKEISYIHAEGYPAAEMKHGPIALIDREMPTVVIAPTDELHEKIISNIQQVKARGGSVIAIVTRGDETIPEIADHTLEIPPVPECLSPIIVSIPLQLLAYHIAVMKGCNVDMPRNLAKSVTVE
ncbi:MAG TPA: glutamine--fructose-6-phosphate transaminase (isomerizing) [Muribaculum sp.]|jgi:glucosamine--fructose-6-phosphate aminotransferase (isomerizing)|uniref:glutamine--fructose-6-phosphate transaminase (isomerizing) n=1 Tax=Heminiphilus faecis TaxID=2601703 RepID=UPI000EF5DA86|nr:glutamine--fructose-6-phosphate transaminase (isomerizing) [Heminiphilus faecis]RLT75825.1 glutamine--fructose-6-phosphate transaminase (isomerizing) [bacterium J10(2018)]HRF69189.1 glutamine--fructose-6-phosphate transaminase (isomerizing) [Muribaculum sp.]